ncbi:hypothetical protein DL766_010610 [Monosporascus sp. MC13-8B]|uniref:Clr5 domain-containing protein n=1 Tax=Monosporascus cannonballus TaxID=155416 RepID=A0ABY0H2T7_9PEZI|nr:hypothetical protein DL762_006151 [Monosporascus cannonballus]RYO90958.1 hypothetical protein DL763_005129 [Monosporascus cannonballus]RYP01969.1 hypothetical protein DL766_010610 [Monosporascus sp. MC13-8B]
MEGASPTTTNTSTGNHRGGRPKDWTDDRTRKLIRLYVYTTLPVRKIINVLADHAWEPGKEAANKWLHTLLGHDPRWIKPRTSGEQDKRMAGLRACRRGSKRKRGPAAAVEEPARNDGTASNLTVPTMHDFDNFDGLTLDPSRGPSFAESDASTLARPNQLWADADLRPTHEPLSDLPAPDPRRRANPSPPMPPFLPRSFRGQGSQRQDSGLTNSTDLSVTSSFRARLRDATPAEVKAAFHLIKRCTIPKDANVSASPTFPSFPAWPGREGSEGLLLIVPGDFLNTDLMQQEAQHVSTSSEDSDGGSRKAAIEALSAPNLWPSKGHCSAGLDVPGDLRGLNFGATDDFGNTAFHFIAARCSPQALLDHVRPPSGQLEASGQLGATICSRNTAGQTLLHVLNRLWYGECSSSLSELLAALDRYKFDALATDVYGRSFFHLLRENRVSHERIRELAHPFDMKSLNRRDAFGRKPMDSRSAGRFRRAIAIHRLYPGRPTALTIPTEDPGDARIRPNTGLLKIVTDAIRVDGQPNPGSEDSDGRNAFHCLAEVVLGTRSIEDHARPPSMKRKLGNDMEPKLQEGPLSYRLELLEGVINARVDVNHYDKTGLTPLMAFVKHTRDGTRGDRELRLIITRLVEAGADMEARNRRGETALYMAARLGKQVALDRLIELGANVYVRSASGLNALEAIGQALKAATNETHLYARLHACNGILAGHLGEKWEGVTALEEWRTRRA